MPGAERAARLQVPERLSLASGRAFDERLEAAIASPESQVLVLEGASPTSFCLGFDLASASPDSGDCPKLLADILERVRFAGKPTIACVGGEVLGGGLGLAAACDVVIASDRSRFGLPELLFGLVPATILPVLIERAGPAMVRRLALTGATVSAEEARAAGLVDEVAPSAGLEAAIAAWVRRLSRAEPGAVAELKRLTGLAAAQSVAAAMHAGAELTTAMLRQPTTRQRIAAYAAGDVPWEQA